MVTIGIIGGAGYTGGELVRILLNHPNIRFAFVHSKSQAGKPLYSVHTDLLGDTELTFTGEAYSSLLQQHDLSVIFLCSGHGESAQFLSETKVPSSIRIIDLSTDFRDESNKFVYGLPELQRDRIREAKKIANPGCFATCIQLALLPLAAAGWLSEDVHISAVTGSTGAGQALSPTTHFSWRNNNISIYKAFTHQHLKEIRQSLMALQPNFERAVHFIPYRGDFTRGIMATVYTSFKGSLEDVDRQYRAFYAAHPFTHLSTSAIDIKQVVNTNKCLLHVEKQGNQLLITSVIDNLIKGASGQAVQNMNLLVGLPEDAGLRLKSVAF